MANNDYGFADTLRQYRKDAETRRRLILAQADDIGGRPDELPAGWLPNHPTAIRWATWESELQLRYWNMTEIFGYEPLPGMDSDSVKALRQTIARMIA